MRTLADLRGDVEVVGVIFDVAKPHTRAEAHFPDSVIGGGVSFLHRQIDIGNALAFVDHIDEHRAGLDRQV